MKRSYTYEELTASAEGRINEFVTKYVASGDRIYADWAYGAYLGWLAMVDGHCSVADDDRLEALADPERVKRLAA